MTSDVMSWERVVRPEIKVRAWREQHKLCAAVTIETPAGPVHFTADVDVREVLKALIPQLQQRGMMPANLSTSSGGFGSWAKKLRNMAKKVAQASAIQKVVKAAAAVAKNPVLARAVGLTTIIVPGFATDALQLKKAANLFAKAARGDLSAKDMIGKIKDAALRGVPGGQGALDALRKVAKQVVSKRPLDLLKGVTLDAVNAAQSAVAPQLELWRMAKQQASSLPGPFGMAASSALNMVPGAQVLNTIQAANTIADQLKAGRIPSYGQLTQLSSMVPGMPQMPQLPQFPGLPTSAGDWTEYQRYAANAANPSTAVELAPIHAAALRGLMLAR